MNVNINDSVLLLKKIDLLKSILVIYWRKFSILPEFYKPAPSSIWTQTTSKEKNEDET